MAAKGNVDLIIRAKNDATRNLDQINKALKALSDQQAIVGDSAARADDKLGQLGQELARLRVNAQNLQSLAGISAVMDKATAALIRQQQAADAASQKLSELQQRQQELGVKSKAAADGVAAAAAELRRQESALKAAQLAMSGMSKDTADLVTREKTLETAIAKAGSTIASRSQKLLEAETRQRTLTEAMAAGERVTKTQQNSLEAANRAIEKHRTAVADATAKETELRQKLVEVKAALDGQTSAALNLGGALAQQAAKTTAAKDALATATQTVKTLGGANRTLVTDIAAAALAADREATALRAAQTEMAALTAASNAAKTAVNSSAQNTNAMSAAATKAAFNVATLAARLATLNGLGGRATTNPLGIDPAAVRAAAGSIAQLGVTIRAAANENTRASVTSAELAAAIKAVGASASSLTAISTALASQRTAVAGAKEAWAAAQAEVQRLAVAIKGTAQPSEAMATALGRAQGAARNAKDEFIRQTTAAGNMASSLQQAGIGAGTLSTAEAALGPRIQAANALLATGAAAAARYAGDVRNAGAGAGSAEPPVNRLTTALRAMADAASKAGAATNPLTRLKGELLGVAAAGIGLYGIAGQLKSIWDAGVQLASTQIRFNVAFDGVEEGAKQLAYAREVALNLKVPLAATIKAYAELQLAAKGSALEGDSARKIWLGFSQAARVTGATAEETKGVFKALRDILSKGKVQAEELRQQLGDRLPGAMQVMAVGLGITTAELDKMMKKGELTSATLLNMSATMSQRMAPQLENALKSPAARLQDFQNRMQLFKEQVAGSGFLDAVAEAFDKLAKALSTPEALAAAQGLGKALADIVTWATELVSSGDLDDLWESFKTLGAVWIGLQMASMITGLYGFATAIGVTAIATLGLDAALAPILVGLGALAAVVATVAGAFIAWKLAEWAYDNFPAFAEGVLGIKNSALSAWDGIKQGWDTMAVKLTASFKTVTSKLADIWYGMLSSLMTSFPNLTETLGLGDYAAEVARRAAEANAALVGSEAEVQAKLAAIKEEYAEQDRKRARELQDDIAGYHIERIKAGLTEEEKAANKLPALADPNRVSFPGAADPDKTKTGLETVTAAAYVPDTSGAEAKAAAAAAKKAGQARVSLEKSVADQMFAIRSSLEKKSAETLDQQVAAVGSKYAKLYGQLTALGKGKESQEWQDVDALVAQEQAIIRQTAAKKAKAAQDKADRAAESAANKANVDAMKSVEALYRTRKNLQEQLARAQLSGDDVAANELVNKIANITAQADTATAKLLEFWQSAGESGEADAAIAKLEQLRLTLTKVDETAVLTGLSIAKALGASAKNSMDGLVDSIADGTPVLQALGDAFVQFAREFLINIAKMILQQMLLNAISGAFGNIAGTIGGAITQGAGGTAVAAGSANAQVGVFHSGGIAGTAGRTMSVDSSMFANAARHHTGGVAGLKSNEVPIVAEKGEEILTADDPRHVNNGGGGKSPVNLKLINMIDSASVVSEGLNTVDGEEAVLNILKANRTAVRSLLT